MIQKFKKQTINAVKVASEIASTLVRSVANTDVTNANIKTAAKPLAVIFDLVI